MLDVYLIRYKEDPDGQGVAGFWTGGDVTR